MRRSVSKIPYRPSAAPSSIAVAFSTSSGGGGRGRGGPNPFHFTVPTPSNADSKNPNPGGASPPPHGHGRGRGRGSPVSSSPVLPSFNSFLNNDSSSAAPGRGRGVGFTPPNFSSPPPTGNESKFDVQTPKLDVKNPFLFGEAQSDWAESEAPPPREKALPAGILGVLPGAGRGKPTKPPTEEPSPHPGGRQLGQSPNKDTAIQSPNKDTAIQSPNKDTAIRVQLSQDEKVRRAREILSKGDKSEGARAESGGRGRGRGTARGSRRGGHGGRDTEDYNRYEERDDQRTGQFFPDPADMEKLAKSLGPENMSKIREGLEDMAEEMLPDPRDEALFNNLDLQLKLECEPEFFMENFGSNPDIEEKAPKSPIPLRDALEKMKPVLMSYHGIQIHEEWEEIMEETIKNVSVMKEVVDYYGGPDRATAKQQCGELERVAKTLPASAPASVKRFTDRAVLSLQSNPGWGFDKKCFFMDKLIMEVEQHYK